MRNGLKVFFFFDKFTLLKTFGVQIGDQRFIASESKYALNSKFVCKTNILRVFASKKYLLYV